MAGRGGRPEDEVLFLEIGRLNNELAKNQRELARKNAELERLNSDVQRYAATLEGQFVARTAELRTSESRFKAIFENAAIGIAILDAEGRLAQMNPALETILGRQACDLLGTRFLAFFCEPSAGESFAARYEELAAGNLEQFRAEGRCSGGSGRQTWVNITVSAVRGDEGRLPFAVALLEDVTERKEAQAALMQSERLALAGELAASLAHEVNNPLQGVIGFLALGREALAEGEDIDEYLELALRELRRVAEIVSRMRDLHRKPEPDQCVLSDVNALVDRVLALCRKRCQESVVEVVWEAAPDIPEILVMADGVHQVILNLVLNALDAMPDGGTLRVSTGRTGEPDGVTVTVIDTGVGIPSEAIARIFDPFHSTKSKGLGLGLFVSQNIVQQHGGSLEVESRPGYGTTFRAWLPVR